MAGGAFQGRDGRRRGRRHDGGDIGGVGGAPLGGIGRRAENRDDGPGYRLPHRGDHQRLGAPQRRGELRWADVGQLPFRGDVGQAAQDLGQDHPGVAAGAAQRAVGQAAGHRDQVEAVAPLQRRDRRAHGEQHVGAGVGVGDREDIETVDLVGVGDEVPDGGMGPTSHRGCVEPCSRHLHLLKRRTSRAGHNSHRGRQRGRCCTGCGQHRRAQRTLSERSERTISTERGM